jgi:hypothetical protein
MNNPVRWFEIYVQDMGRARAFYEQVLGRRLVAMQSGDIEMWGFGGDPATAGTAGALVRVPGVTGGGFGTMVYFATDDCAIEAARVAEAGGRLHRGKMSIGQYGYVALAVDTEGNMFGLHSQR